MALLFLLSVCSLPERSGVTKAMPRAGERLDPATRSKVRSSRPEYQPTDEEVG